MINKLIFSLQNNFKRMSEETFDEMPEEMEADEDSLSSADDLEDDDLNGRAH